MTGKWSLVQVMAAAVDATISPWFKCAAEESDDAVDA